MLQRIKIVVFTGFFNINCQSESQLASIDSNISLSGLPPVIQVTDFIEKPVGFSEMIKKYYKLVYVCANVGFYISLFFTMDIKKLTSEESAHVFFCSSILAHMLVSLLPLGVSYFKFRTIFAVVNNGVAATLLGLGISDKLPLQHSGGFYFSVLLTHLIMNTILFINNRKTLMIDLKDLVEELQEDGQNMDLVELI